MDGTYTRRYVDDYLDHAMEHLPAFLVTGPRACGKTTTAARRATDMIRFDRPNEAELFHGQPDAHLAQLRRPTVIDEWQIVPESMSAVKRAVDGGAAPGSFLMTGSVRARETAPVWPGTGRLIPVRMHGLTQGELVAAPDAAKFLERLFGGRIDAGELPNAPSLFDYIDLAAAGGFPEALALPDDFRSDWYGGYVSQVVGRDAPELAEIRSPQALFRTLRAVAVNTAGTPTMTTLASAIGADHRTVARYLDLFEELGIIERLPAWTSNRLSRMVKLSKTYIADPALALHLTGLDGAALLRDGGMRGRVIDAFVLSQLRPLLGTGALRATAHHARTPDGRHEIDLILESLAGDIVAIEVKAAGDVRPSDARHLVWLRDRAPDLFRVGVVFHTGSMITPLSDRIWAMPIAALWSRVS